MGEVVRGPCGYDICGKCGMSRHNHISTFPLACRQFVESEDGLCEICKKQREAERATQTVGTGQ